MIKGNTRRPFKRTVSQRGQGTKEKAMQIWGREVLWKEKKKKLPFFLTPRTSCLRAELYIELWEWVNRQWSGSQCGRMLLWRQQHSHSPFWQPSSNCHMKNEWNFNWGCISVWSEVSNFGRSIPKRLTHPFQPRGLYNMLYEGFCLFCFLHMKQILTHSSVLRGEKLQDSCIKTVSLLPGTSLPQEVLTVPCVSVFSPQGTPTLKWWWTIMGNSRFLPISFCFLTANPTYTNLEQKEHKIKNQKADLKTEI